MYGPLCQWVKMALGTGGTWTPKIHSVSYSSPHNVPAQGEKIQIETDDLCSVRLVYVAASIETTVYVSYD